LVDIDLCLIGLGYVGLPTAVLFASKGLRVHGVDINENLLKKLETGSFNFPEPGLGEILSECLISERFTFGSKIVVADNYIIAVPTPVDKHSKPDLSYVTNVVEQLAPNLKKGDLIILESTAPVGTTVSICELLQSKRPDLVLPSSKNEVSDISVAYCPERVLPGNALIEIQHNARIIGGISQTCTDRGKELYTTIVTSECLVTNATTAEMVKLTENACRDVEIAFANELDVICHKVGIDAHDVIRMANRHPRVNILNPGPGVGGHCIAVDPLFLISSFPQETGLITTARKVNSAKPDWVVKQIHENIRKSNKKADDIVISFLGATYKENIDDCRESPAIEIIEKFADQSEAKLYLVEPHLTEIPKKLENLVEMLTLSDACLQSDLIVILVKHSSFFESKCLKQNRDKILDIPGLLR
jgi:UDP-N-acetyl-D-mannosaminuronic acid dehydrogenase